MKQTYLILNLYGQVLAQYEAFSEYDAGNRYEREIASRGEMAEAYQVMTRRDWVTWKTQPESFYDLEDGSAK